MKKIVAILLLLCVPFSMMWAGNPDRSGEAGASELLINPWAQSSGWFGVNVATVKGVESMRANVAGLSFTNKTEINFSQTIWLEGSDVNISAFGLAQRLGEGCLGISLMSMSFGDVPVTTTDLPEGTGATFNPSFTNLGLSYSHRFADYLSGGFTLRGVIESISDVSAFGFAMDVGILYTTGSDTYPEQVKFGVALRNIGGPMKFKGDGLTFRTDPPSGDYVISADQQAASFELPSQLSISLAYDFHLNPQHRLTAQGTFISNAFYKDQFGAGLEYGFKSNGVERFQLRAAYRYEQDILDTELRTTAYTGLAAGFSFLQPFSSEEDSPVVAIDYGYRPSDPFNGTHSIGVRLNL